MITNIAFSRQEEKSFTANCLRMVIGLSLALMVANQAVPQQYPQGSMGSGGTTGGIYTAPSGGYGSAGKAAGIGAGAAAGAGILYLALRSHAITGCVQPGEDGLRFIEEKKNTSYALLKGDVYLKAGQRVELKGHKSKSESGAPTFTAKKLVKDLGGCEESKPVAGAKPAAGAQNPSY